MIRTLSFESKSEFLPSFKTNIFVSDFNPIMVEELRQLILDEEPKIIKDHGYMDPSPNGGPDFLTQRLYFYNLFDYQNECVKELYSFVKEEFTKFIKCSNKTMQKTYIHGWGNVIRKGYKISKHAHKDAHTNIPTIYSYLSGNMCLYAENTKTYYENPFLSNSYENMKNIMGQNVIFPAHIIHMTDTNESETPRVSLAYDIITQQQYDLITNCVAKNNSGTNKKFWMSFTDEI